MAFRASIQRLAAKMTEAERTAILRDANEKMKAYHMNRPPIHKVKPKKKFSDNFNDNAFVLQFSAASTFLVAFLITPFLGRKIARDEEFRNKFIPSWYDFSMEKPKNAWTRRELHEQYIKLQTELHERAIRGEFTPEKLEEMRRHFDGVDPKEDVHGWGKLHPGVDDDEDIEDD